MNSDAGNGRDSEESHDSTSSHDYNASNTLPTTIGSLNEDDSDTIGTMSFHNPRCIRLLCLPDEVIDAVRDTIKTHWAQGLQDEHDQARALEFQLKGYPWFDSVLGPRLVCRLLEALYRQGWTRLATTALSVDISHLDQIFFERTSTPLPPQHWMTVVFDGTNKVDFLDAPGDILAVSVASLGSEKETHGPAKLQGCYEFRLKGKPWRGRPQDDTTASVRVMTILSTLKRNGWQIYSNFGSRVIQRDKYCLRRPDAWICCRSADWDPSTSPDFQ